MILEKTNDMPVKIQLKDGKIKLGMILNYEPGVPLESLSLKFLSHHSWLKYQTQPDQQLTEQLGINDIKVIDFYLK